jgi:hypothetical protein
MRIPAWLAPLGLLLLAPPFTAPARADAPIPEGTEEIALFEGRATQVPARFGSQVVCDDPAVAHGEIRDEKFFLVAGRVGKTLCGVRFNGVASGVYAVTVKPAPPDSK